MARKATKTARPITTGLPASTPGSDSGPSATRRKPGGGTWKIIPTICRPRRTWRIDCAEGCVKTHREDRTVCFWDARIPKHCGSKYPAHPKAHLLEAIMDFKIWKVERIAGNNPSWYSYSIQNGPEIPVILTQDQFVALFPEITPEQVPTAPNATTIRIEAKLNE